MAVVLTGLIDCKKCGATYEGTWTDAEADTVQDMDAPPEQWQQCQCGWVQLETWPGWAFYTDAGLRGGK